MGRKARFGVDRAGRLLAATALAVGAVVAVQVAPPAGDGGSVLATAPDCTDTAPTLVDGKYVIDTPGKLLHVASNSASTFAAASLVQTAPLLDLTNCGNWPGIGAPDTPFTGTYDGGGNTISNLNFSISDENEWGLFRRTSGASISNLTLTNISLTDETPFGWVRFGSLVGYAVDSVISDVTVRDVAATGVVTRMGGMIGGVEVTSGNVGSLTDVVVTSDDPNMMIFGEDSVGGLIGHVQLTSGTFTLTRAMSNIGVTHAPEFRDGGNQNGEYLGGLIGRIQSWSSGGTAIITDVSAHGTVSTSATGSGNNVGGLIGYVEISDASSTATISAATATGHVLTQRTNNNYIGGLIGRVRVSTDGWFVLEESSAHGNVFGGDEVGGLIGYLDGSSISTRVEVRRSFSTGNVEAKDTFDEAGGLIGRAGKGVVTDSYARGAVAGVNGTKVAGLIAEFTDIAVARTYATGTLATISGTPQLFGLIGNPSSDVASTFEESFWDTDTLGIATSNGGTGKTTADMKSLTTFDDAGWSISAGDQGSTTWGICSPANDGYPFLMWQTQLAAGHPGVASCSTGGGTGDGNGSISPEPTSPETIVPEPEPEPEPEPAVTGPAPVLVNGAVPQMAPGEIVVYEDGVPVSVQVFVEDDTELVIEASTFDLRLSGECETSCTVEETSEGRYVLTLEEDGTARTEGTGFQPGSVVDVWLFSEPRYLGQVTVGPDGTFTGSVLLGDVEVGEHTLQVNGVTTAGGQRSANMGVLVNSADLETPTLPSAGLGDLAFNWILLLFAAGGLLVLSARRTRRV
jgi:hypothetical protein